MPSNSDSEDQFRNLSDVLLHKGDSQQITDLIQQLERDLQNTRKNAGKER